MHIGYLIAALYMLTVIGCSIGQPYTKEVDVAPPIEEVDWEEVTRRPDGARCWMVVGDKFRNGVSCETANYHRP